MIITHHDNGYGFSVVVGVLLWGEGDSDM